MIFYPERKIFLEFTVFYKFIPKERIHLFDGLDKDIPRQCQTMEDWINSRSGIGFALLGVGMNGHVGFNEPDIDNSEMCFSVPLADSTKLVSVKYFKKELPVETGVTIGLSALLKARNVLLMACGELKAPIIYKTVTGPASLNVPASMFKNHQAINVMLDKEAAKLIALK